MVMYLGDNILDSIITVDRNKITPDEWFYN